MNIVAILGSPSNSSRTARLIEHAARRLQPAGIHVDSVSVYDFPADDLLYGNFAAPAVQALQQRVAAAQGVIIATPVYKAAYAGALKVLLDLIPEGGFAGKPVLPLASGGSPGHLLAVDYAIKPVLAALKASEIHQGVFAVDSQIGRGEHGELAAELAQRLDVAVDEFAALLHSAAPAAANPRLPDDFISRLISL